MDGLDGVNPFVWSGWCQRLVHGVKLFINGILLLMNDMFRLIHGIARLMSCINQLINGIVRLINGINRPIDGPMISLVAQLAARWPQVDTPKEFTDRLMALTGTDEWFSQSTYGLPAASCPP